MTTLIDPGAGSPDGADPPVTQGKSQPSVGEAASSTAVILGTQAEAAAFGWTGNLLPTA